MGISREAKIMCGIILLVIPTIMYGGVTLLGILSAGAAGTSPDGFTLNEMQWAYWRAGHAHAGVWMILSLGLQVLIDSTRLSESMTWSARIAAPVAAILFSVGFFGFAFFPFFRWLLYLGGLCLFIALILTGVGLLMNLDEAKPPAPMMEKDEI
jgi:hypothetical protein